MTSKDEKVVKFIFLLNLKEVQEFLKLLAELSSDC